MRYRISQHYDAPPDAVARAFTDPEFYDQLVGLPKLGKPEVLSRTRDGDRVTTAIRYRFVGDLSGAARKVLDPAKLSWVEHAVHDLDQRSVEFDMVPDHYGDRFRSSGRYAFVPDGDGTLRVGDGDLTVKVPLLGGAVERAIVSGLGEYLTVEAPVASRFARRSGGDRLD